MRQSTCQSQAISFETGFSNVTNKQKIHTLKDLLRKAVMPFKREGKACAIPLKLNCTAMAKERQKETIEIMQIVCTFLRMGKKFSKQNKKECHTVLQTKRLWWRLNYNQLSLISQNYHISDP